MAMVSGMNDLARLRELQSQRLSRMLDLCAAAHPFYRRRFAETGLPVSAFASLDGLERLPLTTKAEYMAASGDFRLEASGLPGLPLQETTLWNVAYTTGTTSGRPSPFFNTTHDQLAIMLQARQAGTVEGFRPSDVLASLIPLPPMPTGGFLVVPRTAEAIVELDGQRWYKTGDKGHMDKVVIRFVDDTHFTSQWTWYQEGKEQWLEEIKYERKQAAESATRRPETPPDTETH